MLADDPVLQADTTSAADTILVITEYHKVSNISHTKSQNLNDSRLALPLSQLDPLERGVKPKMKM